MDERKKWKKQLRKIIVKSYADIIPKEDVARRRRLPAPEAIDELKVLIKQFKRKISPHIEKGEYEEAVRTIPPFCDQVGWLGTKYLGKPYTFESDQIRQWGHEIMICCILLRK